jgi:hypothetical protein
VLENQKEQDPTNESVIYTGPTSQKSTKGIDWFASGYKLFREHPVEWVLTMVVGFLILLAIQLLPEVLSLISSFTTFIWSGGLFLGCHAVKQGSTFSPRFLFEGFKTHFLPLAMLSGINFIVMFLLSYLILGPIYLQMLSGELSDPSVLLSPEIAYKMLVILAIYLPFTMALWFAPVLIVIQNMTVKTAMIESFKGCYKNVVPYLLYGVLTLFFYILAVIPLGLGLLVFVPTFFASIYVAYEDIYTSASSETIAI